jgi:glycosyltransferase involved in cell wall biosynthesis
MLESSMSNLSSDRPRLLLLAHSCHPNAGSEPGLGWNRALQAARQFSTWVLCDAETSRAAVEAYLKAHGPIPRLEFVFVPPNRFEQRLRRLPGMFYPAYQFWHRRAFKISQKLHSKLRFDLVHQVNLCSFREPGYLWQLDVPYVWGPVGGAQNYPWRFITSAGLVGAASESIRNLLNKGQMRFSRRVGRAARKASVFLTANTTNARELKRRCLSTPQVMLETGVHRRCEAPLRDFRHDGPLRILWSGVFEHRKALHLLLRALSMLPPNVPYELRILGRGPLERRWRRLATRLNIERHCRWLGWVDHREVLDQYSWADVFVFTSLRDTTGTVVLESLAAGTPVLTLNHQGVADIVTDDCGVRLPVTTPREVACGLRDTLVRWYNNRAELESLSHGAFARADHYSWDRQGARMAAVYQHILDQSTETFPTGSDQLLEKSAGQVERVPAEPCLLGHSPATVAARKE